MLRQTTLATLLAATILMSGCIGVGSSRSYNQTPTTGQQLSDLKMAHNQGAIDDEEYERLKQDIMDNSPKHHRR